MVMTMDMGTSVSFNVNQSFEGIIKSVSISLLLIQQTHSSVYKRVFKITRLQLECESRYYKSEWFLRAVYSKIASF